MGDRKEKTELIGSNVHYFYYDTEYFFQSMMRSGYSAVELYLGTPHIFIDSHVIDDFCNVKKIAEKYGIQIKSVHPETISLRYSLCQPDDRWLSRSVQAYKNAVDFAAGIGAESVNTNLTGAGRDLDFALSWKQMSGAVKEVAEYSGERGVNLILETESSEFEGFVTNIEMLEKLLDEIDDDSIGVGVNVCAMKAAEEDFKDWEESFGAQCRYIRVGNMEEKQEAVNWINLQKRSWEIIHYPTDDRYLDHPGKFDLTFTGKEVFFNETD